jgi:hypothetical protein
MSVTSDYDPSASFADLKTFSWLPEPDERTQESRIPKDSFVHQRICTAVEKELTSKGFQQQTSGVPDFQVGYHVTLDKQTNVAVLNNHYGYSPGWAWRYGYAYRPYGYVGAPETYVYQYDEGTLILDIVDPKTNQLIWRGSATDEVNLSATAEMKQKQINEAVTRLLEKFPPQ